MNKDFTKFLMGVGVACVIILVLWIIGIVGFSKIPSKKTMPGDGAIQKDSTFTASAPVIKLETDVSKIK